MDFKKWDTYIVYNGNCSDINELLPEIFYNSWVIRQNGESQNGGNKKTNHAKFFEKRTFWCAFFSCYLRFEIRSFALSLTNCALGFSNSVYICLMLNCQIFLVFVDHPDLLPALLCREFYYYLLVSDEWLTVKAYYVCVTKNYSTTSQKFHCLKGLKKLIGKITMIVSFCWQSDRLTTIKSSKYKPHDRFCEKGLLQQIFPPLKVVHGIEFIFKYIISVQQQKMILCHRLALTLIPTAL